MIFCYRVYGEAALSWIYRHIAVSEKLSPSTENNYLYLSPSTENQLLYQIQVLNLRLICKASIYSLEGIIPL